MRGLEFVFVFAHDYLFGLWIFPESPSLEAALGLDGYTNTYVQIHAAEYYHRYLNTHVACGCSMELLVNCLTTSDSKRFIGLKVL